MTRAAIGFIERFRATVEREPDRVAIEVIDEGTRLTYAELLASCERHRASFSALGVVRGDRVLVILASGPEFVAVFYALASIGAVAVLLNDRVTRYELAPMTVDAAPRGAVVGTKRGRELVASFSFEFIVDLDAASAQVGREELAPPGDGAIVSCHFTYKGLGYPLGAQHRYESYSRCVDGLTRTYPGTERDNTLVLLPMQPVYGLVTSVLAPLASGQRVIVVARPTSCDLVALLAEQSVRFVCLIPMLVDALVAAVKQAGPRARAGLRPELEIACGGSTLSPATAEAASEVLGRELLQGYGTTETLPITVSPSGDTRRGTVGTPLGEGVALRIVSAEGAERERGRSGRVVVTTPTLMTGYIGRPDETARFLVDGGFSTGDLGSVGDDGHLVFEGRWLPFGKSFGQMVDFVELERVACEHPRIVEARASGSADRAGESIRLAVVLDTPNAVTEREVLAFLRSRLSMHKVPRRVKLSVKSARTKELRER